MLCLYGGAVACVVALFKITPAAAMRTIENENLVPGVLPAALDSFSLAVDQTELVKIYYEN